MKLISVLKDKRTLFKNSFMQYLLLAANYIFPLLTFPYLTRILGPEKFGAMIYVYAIIAYMQMIMDFGFMLSATKEVVDNREDKVKLGRIIGNVILSKLFLALVCLIALVILILSVELLNNNIMFTYLSFVAAVLTILLPDYLFLGLEEMSILTIRHVISKGVTTLLIFVLIKSDNDFLWVPTLSIIGVLLSSVLTWIVILRNKRIKIFYTNLKECVDTLKTSFDYFIANIATTAFGALNTVVLGNYVPITQIAFWGISERLIGMAQSLYSPIINSIYPYMIAKKDFVFMKKIIIIGLIPITIATCFSFIFASQLINLLCGLKYNDAIPVFRALSPVLIFSFPVLLFGFPVLGAMGKVKAVSYSTVYTSIFHLAGMAVLIAVNKLSILNLALLRSLTELFILSLRAIYIFKGRNNT